MIVLKKTKKKFQNSKPFSCNCNFCTLGFFRTRRHHGNAPYIHMEHRLDVEVVAATAPRTCAHRTLTHH